MIFHNFIFIISVLINSHADHCPEDGSEYKQKISEPAGIEQEYICNIIEDDDEKYVLCQLK